MATPVQNVKTPKQHLLSDKKLINWINRKAGTEYGSIGELGDCVGYIILFKKLYSQSIDYQSANVEIGATLTSNEKEKNWHILEKGFKKVGVTHNMQGDIDLGISGDYEWNKTFIEWFKEFYEVNHKINEMPQDDDEKKAEDGGKDDMEMAALSRVQSTTRVSVFPGI